MYRRYQKSPYFKANLLSGLMKNRLTFLLMIVLTACQRNAPKPAQPDYEDWYALTAPKQEISKGYTVILTVPSSLPRVHIYTRQRTRAKPTKANYNDNNWLFSITAARTRCLLSLLSGVVPLPKPMRLSPEYFSVDQGVSWQTYRCFSSESCLLEIPLSHVQSASGTEYSIDVLLTPIGPASGPNWVETVGVVTSTGDKISLPASHQINSLYFDKKSRLYVVASAPVCGRLENFSFCGKNERRFVRFQKAPALKTDQVVTKKKLTVC